MTTWCASRLPPGLVLAAGLWISGMQSASAETTCHPTAEAGVERCVSGLSASTLSSIFQPQQASNWCWAASIAMVLRRYGVSVPQDQVVRTAFGQAGNQRASALAIAELLNRKWSDAAGNSLVASAHMLAPWRRDLGVAAPEVIEDLSEGKPLLLGVQQHAMVLVQVTYERRVDGTALTPAGVRMLRALALDPASANWLRTLQPAEHAPELLARVEVDVQSSALALAQARGNPLQ